MDKNALLDLLRRSVGKTYQVVDMFDEEIADGFFIRVVEDGRLLFFDPDPKEGYEFWKVIVAPEPHTWEAMAERLEGHLAQLD